MKAIDASDALMVGGDEIDMALQSDPEHICSEMQLIGRWDVLR